MSVRGLRDPEFGSPLGLHHPWLPDERYPAGIRTPPGIDQAGKVKRTFEQLCRRYGVMGAIIIRNCWRHRDGDAMVRDHAVDTRTHKSIASGIGGCRPWMVKQTMAKARADGLMIDVGPLDDPRTAIDHLGPQWDKRPGSPWCRFSARLWMGAQLAQQPVPAGVDPSEPADSILAGPPVSVPAGVADAWQNAPRRGGRRPGAGRRKNQTVLLSLVKPGSEPLNNQTVLQRLGIQTVPQLADPGIQTVPPIKTEHLTSFEVLRGSPSENGAQPPAPASGGIELQKPPARRNPAGVPAMPAKVPHPPTPPTPPSAAVPATNLPTPDPTAGATPSQARQAPTGSGVGFPTGTPTSRRTAAGGLTFDLGGPDGRPRKRPLGERLYAAGAPAFPCPTVARVPPAPPLPDGLSDLEMAQRLMAAYRTVMGAFCPAGRFVLIKGNLARWSGYGSLVNAAKMLQHHRIAPIAWVVWRHGWWASKNGPDVPIPVRLAFSVEAISGQHGWWRNHCEGGQLMVGAVYRAFIDRWRAMEAEILFGPDDDAAARAVVARHFPPGTFEGLMARAEEEAQVDQQVLDAQAARGWWLPRWRGGS